MASRRWTSGCPRGRQMNLLRARIHAKEHSCSPPSWSEHFPLNAPMMLTKMWYFLPCSLYCYLKKSIAAFSHHVALPTPTSFCAPWWNLKRDPQTNEIFPLSPIHTSSLSCCASGN